MRIQSEIFHLKTLRSSVAWQSGLLGLAFLGVFLAFPTADYSYDAIGYVGFIHQATYLEISSTPWHEYHILYIPLGYVLAKMLLVAGFLPDILDLMQVLNAIFSALALMVFFRLLRDETGGAGAAVFGTCLLAFSYSYWYYATDPEVYPPCLLFLLLTFHFGRRLARRETIKDAILTGFCHGLAVGFHVAAALLAPLILVVPFLFGEKAPLRRRRLAGIAVYGFVGLLVALLPYIVKYQSDEGTTLMKGLFGRFDYALRQESAEGRKWFLGEGYRPVEEFKGLQRGFAPPPMENAKIPSEGALLLRSLLPVLFLVPLARFRFLNHENRGSLLFFGAWFALFFGFFTAYNVGSIKFVSFQIIPLIYLFALSVAPALHGKARKLPVKAAFWGWVILLAAVNFFGNIQPGSLIENNGDYRKTEFIRKNTSEGDLVIHFGMGENIKQKVFLPYFGAREELILDLLFRGKQYDPEEILAALEARIRERMSLGRRVLVLSDVIENQALNSQFHRRHSLPPTTLGDFFQRFRPAPHATMDPSFSLYVLNPVASASRTRSQSWRSG